MPRQRASIACGGQGDNRRPGIRAKHGYPLEDEKGNPVSRNDPDAKRTIELLTNENERQAGQISRLEERIAVLERIATDPAERTAREIDALR